MSAASRKPLIGICALAFLLRVGAFLALGRLSHPEVWENVTVAMNLLQGKGFTYEFFGTVYRSYTEPLYPGLCAVVYHLTGHSSLALGVVQALIGTILVWLVFLCAREVVSESSAALAAALTALHPGLILFTTKFHPFILDSVFLVSVLAACLVWPSQRGWRPMIVLGGLIGLAVLTRPTVLACGPAIGWWVWTRSRESWKGRLLQLVVMGLCAMLVVGPWVWRNYRIHKRLMLTRSGTSIVFWLGNNPYRFTGSALMPTGKPILTDAVPREIQDHLRTLDELGQQDFLMAQALQYIRDNPRQFLQRWALKLWYFWWFSPQAGLLYPRRWFQLYQGVYLGILTLSLAALWAYGRERMIDPARRSGVWLLLGCCLSISLLQSLFYVEGRHRLAIEPLLLIFTAHGLRLAFGQVRRRLCASSNP